MKNNLALRPCPFCGFAEVEHIVRDANSYNRSILKEDDKYRCGVLCPSCRVMVVGASAGEVAARWNKREGDAS